MSEILSFDAKLREIEGDGQLVLDLDGYDGPIDLLLTLAREAKIDLTALSITVLADQYIAFIERARKLRLELAADYLVMAAWLAWLKSKALLPDHGGEDDEEALPDAARLAFQMRRLAAVQKAAVDLSEGTLLGTARFARGAPEPIAPVTKAVPDITLLDLLQAYGRLERRRDVESYAVNRFPLMTVDEALERLSRVLGPIPAWVDLARFLPQHENPLQQRAALAATFGAGLELAKRGEVELQQAGAFAPIMIRRRTRPREEGEEDQQVDGQEGGP